MAGPRARFRYGFLMSDGSTVRRCFIECDADAASLVLAGLSNAQASVPAANQLMNALIPVYKGTRSDLFRARSVRIRFTGALPPNRQSPLLWVPVFNNSTFETYRVGQTGTFRGLPVELVQKIDGVPSRNGALI